MDINHTLENARQAAARIKDLNQSSDAGRYDDIGNEAVDLAEAFQAIDGWMKTAGFLPAAWNGDR